MMYTLNILQLGICRLHLKAEKKKQIENFKKSVVIRNQSNNMIIKTGRKKRQVANKLINQNCSKTETFNLCKTDLMIRKKWRREFCFSFYVHSLIFDFSIQMYLLHF